MARYTAFSAVPHSSASYGDGNPNTTHEAGVAGESVLDVEFSSSGKASFMSTTRDGNPGSDAIHASQGVLAKDSTFAVSSSGAAQKSFSNGNIVDQFMLNESGDNSRDAGVTAIEQIIEDASVPALSVDEERLWSIVRANSLDFDAWIALIEETDKVAEGNILKIRRVYDSFLSEFLLCYGYWKKYAEHEASESTEKAIQVYERAVLGVTYSVDIWLHYCRLSITKYDDPEVIRSYSGGLYLGELNYGHVVPMVMDIFSFDILRCVNLQIAAGKIPRVKG